MLLIMSFLACADYNKSYLYDISSTVLISDEDGMQLNAKDVELCQLFQSQDYDTRTAWTVQAQQCDIVDVENGIALLPNWEGEYFGPDVSIFVELRAQEETYPAELIDNDSEVWCDNQRVDEYDENGNAISFVDFCAENYERYLLWSIIVPTTISQ